MVDDWENRYDAEIHDQVVEHFPELLRDLTPFGWLWVKAQVWQESRMNPEAVSPVGAAGLMQLMPMTDKEIDGDIDGFDVEGNIDNGVKYLATQYRRFPEIPNHRERLLFALGSYNGGRGYINKALELARIDEGLPGNYRLWAQAGRRPGHWQLWDVAAPFLSSQKCAVRGRHPDFRQIWDYVAKIEKRAKHYLYRKAEG